MKRHSNRGCLLYGIGFFIGIPLLLVVLGVLVIAGRERTANRKLKERLDKIVAQLVHIAIESMGISVLRSALERDVLNEKDLIALLPRILEGINIKPQWKLAMQGERAMMLPCQNSAVRMHSNENVPLWAILDASRSACNVANVGSLDG